MPNAKDAVEISSHKLLAVGPAGSGKTIAFATLPGRKFIYLFDPNALQSLRGFDIDYEQFLPDIQTVALKSLSKGKGDVPKAPAQPSTAYPEWEEHFETSLANGFFNQYDWLGFDGATTFLDMIMDRMLVINGRAGQWPNKDDYGPQTNTFRNIMRAATSIMRDDSSFVNLYVTGHIEPNKDEITGRVFNTIIMTGKLRQKVPNLFSDMLVTEANTDAKGLTRYTARTRPDRMNPAARCSIRDINSVIDLTVDWSKPIEGQGLGRYFK